MSKESSANAISAEVSLGRVQAEVDHLLSTSYFDNGAYRAIQSPIDRRCFIVGRTGSGKSAAFRHLAEQHPAQVVKIKPENLAFNYLTNLTAVQTLSKYNIGLDPFLKVLWKHVLVVEILRHRYGLTSSEQTKSMLARLRDKFRRDTNKLHAIEYVEQFGEKFWCDVDVRVREIADHWDSNFKALATAGTSLAVPTASASATIEATDSEGVSHDDRIELTARYEAFVNEAQIPRLNTMISLLDEILDTPKHFIYVLIDDLDQRWADPALVLSLIRCLFECVHDLMIDVKNIKILVALRTNIFEKLDYGGDQLGGQEEKYLDMSLTMKWTRADLESMLARRARAASDHYELHPPFLIPESLPSNLHTSKSGNVESAIDYIINRTLMRPRDAISYVNFCLSEASAYHSILWKHIFEAETDHSVERFNGLRDEWKDPYFDIDAVLRAFWECPVKMDQTQLTEILLNISNLVDEQHFRGTGWLEEFVRPIRHESSSSTRWSDMFGPLVFLLYDISFLGIADDASSTVRYSYQDSTRARKMREIFVNREMYVEVHPAFRAELRVGQGAVRGKSVRRRKRGGTLQV